MTQLKVMLKIPIATTGQSQRYKISKMTMIITATEDSVTQNSV